MVPENVFLMHSLNMGVYLSLIYDGFRILRRVFSHNDLLISLEDIAFWIYAAGAVFMLMYRESNGMLRWFAILGGLFGVLVYQISEPGCGKVHFPVHIMAAITDKKDNNAYESSICENKRFKNRLTYLKILLKM